MRKTELQINLKSIKDNLSLIKKYTSSDIQAVVKAGAYGLSLDEVYNAISNSTIWSSQMQFIRMNLEDRKALPKIFKEFKFDMVCNLAAQAGVRYSLENAEAYIDSNINGFFL